MTASYPAISSYTRDALNREAMALKRSIERERNRQGFSRPTFLNGWNLRVSNDAGVSITVREWVSGHSSDPETVTHSCAL